MLIHPDVIAAAERRMPAGMAAPAPRRVTPAADLSFAIAPTPAPPPPVDTASFAGRAANLSFGGAHPSTIELERLIGNNDLVDEFYLQRALVAAGPVMRITLRDPAGRERGWATGFMVSPHLLLTNWHVFPNLDEAQNAIAEANYVLDIAGNPAPSYRFDVHAEQYYLANQQLDFALVGVTPLAQDGSTPLSRFGYHRLVAEPNKIREGECITIIEHPGGERRQCAIRENNLVKILDQFLWYQSDTAPGSSGAPAFNDSFQVVALHHSGAAKRDEDGKYVLKDGSLRDSLDGVDESQVIWVANEGLRISVLCTYLQSTLDPGKPVEQELLQAMRGGDVLAAALKNAAVTPTPVEAGPAPSAPAHTDLPAAPGTTLTIPLQLQISLGWGGPVGLTVTPQAGQTPSSLNLAPSGLIGEEALRYPVVDRDYSSRTGYDTGFLGIDAPLPQVSDTSLVAVMADGKYAIPYEHFTVVLNKKRRLALFTASNVDYAPAKREPEPGDYSRDGLTGLGPHDQEKWLTDPRIPQLDQLPDVFYTKDGGSFDKGHIVRRNDVCWGSTRAQVVRANGDTFHVTNCSPQVAGFNRPTSGVDNWGDLEVEIQKQSQAEKHCILAGPILAESDRIFDGKDDFGPVRIQIPVRFWKVILANEEGKLAAYGFILQQDLSSVPEEFSVNATWKPYLIALDTLEAQLSGFVFPPEIHKADRSAVSAARKLARSAGAEIHPSLERDKRPHQPN